MLDTSIKFECRQPAGLSAVSGQALYKTTLDMIQWADQQGFHTINFCEHHGSDDGYLSAPLMLAAAAAAVTDNIRLQPNVVMPYYDPIRVAEDTAVLDLISAGRAELVVLGGYVPSEFEMFGAELANRGVAIEEGIAVLRQAWTGESFEYKGRAVKVTPQPVQAHIPIHIGGGVPVAARRAARIADGFMPMFPAAYEAYQQECKVLSKQPYHRGSVTSLLNIAEDPDQAWEQLAPHALHETNCYARWQAQTGVTGIFEESTDAASLRESGVYLVLTPQQCLDMISDCGDEGYIMLHPLVGGIDPEFGWNSLRLFADQVMPHLR